jgi:hypothetical protein
MNNLMLTFPAARGAGALRPSRRACIEAWEPDAAVAAGRPRRRAARGVRRRGRPAPGRRGGAHRPQRRREWSPGTRAALPGVRARQPPGLLLPGRHGRTHRHAAPRRAHLHLPGGSVSIGGAQTGVSASAGPSGWNTIGSTTMDFFDPARPAGRAAARRLRALSRSGHRPMIEVLSSTALATVQDAGPHWAACASASAPRAPWTSWRWPSATCCSATRGRGRARDCPCIRSRCASRGLRLRAHRRRWPGPARRSRAVPPWWVTRHARDRCCASGCRWPARGSRAYLALAGGVDVPEVLASRSTQLRGAFGGLEGARVRQGDVLHAANPGVSAAVDFGVVPPALALPLQQGGLPAVRVLPAAEYDWASRPPRARLLGWRMEDHRPERPLWLPPAGHAAGAPLRPWKSARTASCPA